ncbi:MAG: putative transrane anti-sigma factor [Pedosphaera sp.]|nr:putative transrane anti-sigma factor [Pedosphaera sp.]
MINQELQLKLQAFLDGELSEQDAAEVQAWLAREAGAQALLAEMQNTCAALAGHESECRLPESREFFWSKIQREIERQEQAGQPVASVSWFTWLQRHFLPVGGVALLSCLLAVMTMHGGGTGSQLGQVELASDDMGSYTYRDQQQKMTMVWIYDRTADSQFTESSGLASVAPE